MSTTRSIQSDLAFAAAWLDQARFDAANGKPDFATRSMEKRKDCQRRLVSHRAARSEKIAVYQWELADGSPFGCGTRLEFEHWNAEGVNPAGLRLGAIIAYEPESEDARRSQAWERG